MKPAFEDHESQDSFYAHASNLLSQAAVAGASNIGNRARTLSGTIVEDVGSRVRSASATIYEEICRRTEGVDVATVTGAVSNVASYAATTATPYATQLVNTTSTLLESGTGAVASTASTY